MKNRGFTLIELLGILVILSIISIISFVSISNITKNKQEKEYQRFLENIYVATESYLVDNPNTEETYDVSIKTLIDYGYIKENVKNPKTKEYIKEDDYVTVTCNKDAENNTDCNYEFKTR